MVCWITLEEIDGTTPWTVIHLMEPKDSIHCWIDPLIEKMIGPLFLKQKNDLILIYYLSHIWNLYHNQKGSSVWHKQNLVPIFTKTWMANCTGKPNTYNSLMQPEDQAHKIVNTYYNTYFKSWLHVQKGIIWSKSTKCHIKETREMSYVSDILPNMLETMWVFAYIQNFSTCLCHP